MGVSNGTCLLQVAAKPCEPSCPFCGMARDIEAFKASLRMIGKLWERAKTREPDPSIRTPRCSFCGLLLVQRDEAGTLVRAWNCAHTRRVESGPYNSDEHCLDCEASRCESEGSMWHLNHLCPRCDRMDRYPVGG